MILFFLFILGILAYAILAELDEAGKARPSFPGHCPQCGVEVGGDWILCPHCRTILKNTCGGCGKPAAVYHAFCPNCGIARNGGGDAA
ncbi:MAG: zinc ribbon domain-containing protein [Desulfuromonadales bacterium]|jgi:predicted amidophosphoribosyltransferase